MAVTFNGASETLRVATYTAVTTANATAQTGFATPMDLDRMTVTVSGTFGGATVTVQVSNDGTNWAPCTDVFGSALSLTAAGAKNLPLGYKQYRLGVTGGTGDSLTGVFMATRKTKQGR